MNWTPILIVAAIVAVFILFKKSGQISAEDAVAHLNNGALARAINIPLDEVETAVPKRVKDKQQALLLHCASGMRSAMAANKLKALGYVNAFNLGSYGRAESIVTKAGAGPQGMGDDKVR
jgi:rhodanese-related sulfurtransferase